MPPTRRATGRGKLRTASYMDSVNVSKNSQRGRPASPMRPYSADGRARHGTQWIDSSEQGLHVRHERQDARPACRQGEGCADCQEVRGGIPPQGGQFKEIVGMVRASYGAVRAWRVAMHKGAGRAVSVCGGYQPETPLAGPKMGRWGWHLGCTVPPHQSRHGREMPSCRPAEGDRVHPGAHPARIGAGRAGKRTDIGQCTSASRPGHDESVQALALRPCAGDHS